MIESTRYVLLYNLYKKFYDQEPNLDISNRENLNIEMQSLVFLLSWLGNSISGYDFEKDEELDMPISKDLEQDINNTLIGKDIKDITKYEIDINSDLLEVLEILKEGLVDRDITLLKELSNGLYNKYGINKQNEVEKRKKLL